MKTQLKTISKTSLAYTLQIFAVIILFGYAVASPKIEIKEAINKEIITLKINKHLLPMANQNPLPDEKINDPGK